MQEHTIGQIQFFSYKRFDLYRNVTNVVTTRIGGRSSGLTFDPYSKGKGGSKGKKKGHAFTPTEPE